MPSSAAVSSEMTAISLIGTRLVDPCLERRQAQYSPEPRGELQASTRDQQIHSKHCAADRHAPESTAGGRHVDQLDPDRRQAD